MGTNKNKSGSKIYKRLRPVLAIDKNQGYFLLRHHILSGGLGIFFKA
jgi:hypothetical protein